MLFFLLIDGTSIAMGKVMTNVLYNFPNFFVEKDPINIENAFINFLLKFYPPKVLEMNLRAATNILITEFGIFVLALPEPNWCHMNHTILH
ncbi:hypothetical protein TNCV_5009971 [Trichonephila clavipes]|nr:hypothetical protein TNCV_5009971 [Trichonephila clavipes]